MEKADDNTSYLKKILSPAPSGGTGNKKMIGIAAAVLVIILAAAAVLYAATSKPETRYKTSEVRKGDLTVTVTATGTLQPVEQVEVGTEVSGTMKEVLVDYNSIVKKGQILAKLDTTKLEAQVLQSEATLRYAKAKLDEIKATVAETQSKVNRFKKSLELSGGKVPSRTEYDAADAAMKRAKAQEATARADIAKADATLKSNRSDLEKATIRSPINGIVLERKVEPGQTVAASLQTPLLFKLAEDLKQMELKIFVDEADIGQVIQGQSAIFTVDAFPDRKFPAKVKESRYASKTENNVVTYEAVLELDNTEMLLRPGMTATAFITVKSISDATLVPNVALRFTPPQDKTRSQGGGSNLLTSLISRRPPSTGQRAVQQKQGDAAAVWKLEGQNIVRVPVKPGATDGTMTQILEGNCVPGMSVATDVMRKQN
ncbi:MAG: efflux RND transporter periplasmic adaptor subunit [Syntrophorhabdaceae bacterium]